MSSINRAARARIARYSPDPSAAAEAQAALVTANGGVPEARYMRTTSTLNLGFGRVPGTELPGRVEGRLLRTIEPGAEPAEAIDGLADAGQGRSEKLGDRHAVEADQRSQAIAGEGHQGDQSEEDADHQHQQTGASEHVTKANASPDAHAELAVDPRDPQRAQQEKHDDD